MLELFYKKQTCECDLSKGQNVGYDVGEDESHEVVGEVRHGEEQEVEDDAEDVEGDQRDQDLPEHRFQVHVATVQDDDGQKIS